MRSHPEDPHQLLHFNLLLLIFLMGKRLSLETTFLLSRNGWGLPIKRAGNIELIFISVRLRSPLQVATANEERLGLYFLHWIYYLTHCVPVKIKTGGGSENVLQTFPIKMPFGELTPQYAFLGSINHCHFQAFSFFLREHQ